MRRWIATIVVLGVVAACAAFGWQQLNAALHPPPEQGPKPPPPIETKGPPPKAVVADGTYNFGTMGQNTDGEHVFNVRNDGPGDLVVSFFSRTCGCTGAVLGDSEIEWPGQKGEGGSTIPPEGRVTVAPGATAAVKFTWNTELKTSFRTSVRLRSNDPKQPLLEFFVEGEAVPYIETSSYKVVVQEAKNHEPSRAKFEVFSRYLDDLELTSFDSTHPLVSLQFEKPDASSLESRAAKSGVRVAVNVAPDMPVGPYSATMTLHTNCTASPELIITIAGEIQGDVNILPTKSLEFGVVARNDGASKALSIKIRNNPDVTASIASVTPEFLKAHVKLKAIGKGFYQLTVEVPKGAPGGPFEGAVELETDHAAAKTIRIPMRGQVVQ